MKIMNKKLTLYAPVVMMMFLGVVAAPRISEGLHDPGETSAECMMCHDDPQDDGDVYAIAPYTGVNDNHHGGGLSGTPAYTCVSVCHTTGGVVMDPTDVNCLTCHNNGALQATVTQVVPGVNHHSNENYSCIGCHLPAEKTIDSMGVTGSGIRPLEFDCMVCHEFAQDGRYAIQPNLGDTDNHHGQFTGTPTTRCTVCHPGGGALPQDYTENSFCTQTDCHAGDLAIVSGVNHHEGTCLGCHIPGDNVGAGGVTGPGILPVVSDCFICHPDIVPGGAGDNHHGQFTGTPGDRCSVCHQGGGVSPAQTNRFCTQTDCHSGDQAIESGVNHHNGTCVSCHLPGDNVGAGGVTGPGILPVEYDCGVCHQKFDMDEETVLNRMNHPNKPELGTPDCETCHLEGAPAGVAPPVTVCNGCHGGSNGRNAVAPNTPFLSKSNLKKVLKAGMHKNVAPVASMTVVVAGLDVTVTDTSTDADGNMNSVKIQWGDNSKTQTAPGASETHTYGAPGKKKITLTVSDIRGLKSKTKRTVTLSDEE